jgi:hypothetical protein
MMRVSSLAKHWDGLEVQRHGYSHAGTMLSKYFQDRCLSSLGVCPLL